MASNNMDQILLELKPDTIQFLRKQYDLDKPERLEEAIKIIRDWLNKQDHIIKKDYSAEYLERTILHSKGSLERTKTKLDKTAAYRTLLPHFFKPIPDATKVTLINDDIFLMALLPKLTNDHYRVLLLKYINNESVPGFMDFYRYLIMLCEYVLAHDYCNGILAVFDYRDANMFELIKSLDVVELGYCLRIIMDGYGMRIKGIHFITKSKAIDAFVTLIKQVLSAKMSERIQIHNDIDGLHKYMPKEILPGDYGGQEKPLIELSPNLKAVMASEKNMKYFKEMQNACINENYRSDYKFNDQYLGIPGSFRKLNVD